MAKRRSRCTRLSISANESLLLCRVLKAKSKSRPEPSAKRSHAQSSGFAAPDREFAVKFAHGEEHFNSRRFFEAHESWEEIWLKSHGTERRHLQGIIQIAAAFHHHSRQNFAGTKSLLRAGLTKIEDAPNNHWGLRLDSLRTSVERWIRHLEKKVDVAGKRPPKLRRAVTTSALE